MIFHTLVDESQSLKEVKMPSSGMDLANKILEPSPFPLSNGFELTVDQDAEKDRMTVVFQKPDTSPLVITQPLTMSPDIQIQETSVGFELHHGENTTVTLTSVDEGKRWQVVGQLGGSPLEQTKVYQAEYEVSHDVHPHGVLLTRDSNAEPEHWFEHPVTPIHTYEEGPETEFED